jgi:AAA+ superfamily predicted ATPase
MLRASQRTGEAITLAGLIGQKSRDVAEISEQTLAVLDASPVDKVQLVGRNVATPQSVMEKFGKALRRGDPNIPGSLLLVGPPGAGKTDLALIAAAEANVNAYQMHSPKGGIVGQTERQVRLQWETLRAWTPNLSFIDEITEAMPMQRTDFDGDSGASRAVTAAMLTALSDETRRGRSLLVATTNCPWRIGEAMRSRFAVLPVLHPLCEDYAAIVESLARRVAGAALDKNDPCVLEAAEIFHLKGANPRQIRSALSAILLDAGALTRESVRAAALDLRASASPAAVAYCDLWAVKACSRQSWLPWAADPSSYPFPSHLKALVDPATGVVKESELDRRLEELKPHADV